jgi:hypothetical protein
MRLLPLAIATVALSLSLGVSAMACELMHGKTQASQVSSASSPLVERLIALATKQGAEVKTQ